MGSSTSYPISSTQRAALGARADGDGFIRFDDFMEIALYHPTEGYYRRAHERVGRSAQTDYFTASSLGPVFGELVVACCVNLLGANDPANFKFVEYGAEGGRSVLDGVEHPFTAVETIGLTDPGVIEGAAVVFSNELFDAQPCRRFRSTTGGWEELGVRCHEAGISDAVRNVISPPLDLPPPSAPGYHLDWPTGAERLAEQIVGQPWHGLFVAFDYGKRWQELTDSVPQGTARAYHRHRQKTALLEAMGTQDLTCHVCWDHLARILQNGRFADPQIRSQEAFLVKNASVKLAEIMAAEAARLSPRKSGLMQLLHPSALGQKFQVLSAQREES